MDLCCCCYLPHLVLGRVLDPLDFGQGHARSVLELCRCFFLLCLNIAIAVAYTQVSPTASVADRPLSWGHPLVCLRGPQHVSCLFSQRLFALSPTQPIKPAQGLLHLHCVPIEQSLSGGNFFPVACYGYQQSNDFCSLMDLKLRALLLNAIFATALRKKEKERETCFSGEAPASMLFTCQWEDCVCV